MVFIYLFLIYFHNYNLVMITLSYKTRFRTPRFQSHLGVEKPIQRSLAIVTVIDCAGVPLSEATEGIHQFMALRLLLLLLQLAS